MLFNCLVNISNYVQRKNIEYKISNNYVILLHLDL